MTKMRMYFYILGTKPYYKEVSSVEEAKTIINAISDFVNTKVEEGVFPDHCSTAGLEEYDEEEKEWTTWYDENGLDFDEYLRMKSKVEETREAAIDLLSMIEFEQSRCCLNTWYKGIDDDMKEAIEMAIKVLEQEPCDVSKLTQKAYEDGKKDGYVQAKAEQEPCEDAISRQAVEAITWEEPSYTDALNALTEVREKIRALPPVSTEKTGRCKDCKYFEYDSVAKVDGIPLIVAHEICSRWGDGCKTMEDGYCFLFEPKMEVEE